MRATSRLGLRVASFLFATCVAAAVVWSAEPAAEDNPYIASPKLSRMQLGELLDTMLAKPESIRQRPGFSEALVDAADRILKENDADSLAASAVLIKFEALRRLWQAGDNDPSAKEAGERLDELAKQRIDDPETKIASAANFHQLQRQTQDAGKLDGDQFDDDQVAELLKKLKAFFTHETLDNRHVTLASGTVSLINRLQDDETARGAYRDFGGLWAKSKDPELARYGRKIQKGPTH